MNNLILFTDSILSFIYLTSDNINTVERKYPSRAYSYEMLKSIYM